MKAVFLTPHYWGSRRKAGMHWIAEAILHRGWQVVFMTVGMSWPLWIRRRDWRLEYSVRAEANRLVQKEPGLTSFVWITPWHPARTPWPVLDHLVAPLHRLYPRFDLGSVEDSIREADLLVVESSVALLLFQRLTELAPGARTVYRISDDLGTLDYPPVVEQVERAVIDSFDLLSIPSRSLYAQHEHRPHARFHPQGIRTELFDAPTPDPYVDSGQRTRAVFVGIRLLDRQFLEIAADARPDWDFHIIGPFQGLPDRDNIIGYGELPFRDTIPYLKHADIGLNTLAVDPGAAWYGESLKVIQYTYCRLPIVAPRDLRTVGDHFAYYVPDDPESIDHALTAAANLNPEDVDRSWVMSWDEVANALLDEVSLAGPGESTP